MQKQQLGYVAAGLLALGLIGGVIYLNRPVALPQAPALPEPPPAATTTPSAGATTTQVSSSGPNVGARSLNGLGDMATLWKDQVYIMEGETGGVKLWTGGGPSVGPLWSHDGQWLAYVRVTDAQAGSGPLWVVRRDGFGAHQVQGLPESVRPGDFHWSPTADTLAVGSGGLWLVPTDGSPKLLDQAPGFKRFAWSPDGKQIAYNATLPTTDIPNRSDMLYTIAVDGGKPVGQFTAQQAGVVVIGWTPDGAGVLFWQQPLHSGSLAADGMSLYSLKLGEKGPKLLSSGLAHADWQSISPDGKLAMIAGSGRAVWTDKHIDLCDLAAGTCKTLPAPPQSVALDPILSPDGSRIAFVAAKELGREVMGLKPEQVTEWVKSRQLWVMNADGTNMQPIAVASSGVYSPTWSKDGKHIVYLQDNSLWIVSPDGGSAELVAGPLPAKSDLFGMYGYVSMRDLYDWYQP